MQHSNSHTYSEINNSIPIKDNFEVDTSRSYTNQFQFHEDAFVLYNLFSYHECQQIINKGHELEFQELPGYYKDYRTNTRVLCSWPSLLEEWMQRIQPFLTDEIEINNETTTICNFSKMWGNWIYNGLNPQLRLCKYDPTQFFHKHYDAGYDPVPNKVHSFKTCMLYLNESFEGGETVFYDDTNFDNSEDNDQDLEVLYSLKPKTGSCLIFNQQILHEGLTVTEGNKYFIRTDVYYEKL